MKIPIRKYWYKCIECSSRNYIYDIDLYQQKLTEHNCVCRFCGHLNNIDDIKKYEVIYKKEKMAIDMLKEKAIVIDEKRHESEIVNVIDRPVEGENRYHYIDVIVTVGDMIREDGSPMTLKIGFPATWTDGTALGAFLKTMGLDKKDGESIDIEKYLIGKKLSYTTTNKKTPKGIFADVNKNSIEKL